MWERVEVTESAQMLLREIGAERLRHYFLSRLQHIDLPSRPDLIKGYAVLSGVDAFPFVLNVLSNPQENPPCKVAAIEIGVSLAGKLSTNEFTTSLSEQIANLLQHPSQDVRGAAAIALAELNAVTYLPLLQKVDVYNGLPTSAQQLIQAFVAQGVSDALFGVPLSLEPIFTSRKPEWQMLTQALNENLVVALVGPPGIGKTTLARRFLMDSPFRPVVWLTDHDYTSLKATLMDELTRIWVSLGGERANTPADPGEFLAELITQHPYFVPIIVIDDIGSYSSKTRTPKTLSGLVSSLRRFVPTLRCLLIARALAPLPFFAERIVELKGLTRSESLLMLQPLFERTNLQDEAQQQKVIELTYGSPFLIHLLLSMTNEVESSDFRSLLLKEGVDALYKYQLRSLSSRTRRYIEILAQFDDPILQLESSLLKECFWQEKIDIGPKDLQELEQIGILRRLKVKGDVQGWQFVHRLLVDAIRQQTAARTRARVNRYLAEWHQKQSNIMQAARYWARSGNSDRALSLLHGQLYEIVESPSQMAIYLLLLEVLDLAQQHLEWFTDAPTLPLLKQLVDLRPADMESFIKLLSDAAMMYQKFGDMQKQADTLWIVGGLQYHVATTDSTLHEALATWKRSHATYEEINDNDGQARTLEAMNELSKKLDRP